MSEEKGEERPFEGGAQPVAEHRAEVPRGGRAVGQTVVIAMVVLVVVAAVLWLLVPFGG